MDVKPTTVTVVVNYIKSFPCLGPGQLWAELGKGKTDVSYHATQRVGAGDVSDSYQQKRFDMSDLTPNTVYSARGGLGYGFQDYRTGAEHFRTAPDLARNADIVQFGHLGQGAKYAWSFGFSPNFMASRFGEHFSPSSTGRRSSTGPGVNSTTAPGSIGAIRSSALTTAVPMVPST